MKGVEDCGRWWIGSELGEARVVVSLYRRLVGLPLLGRVDVRSVGVVTALVLSVEAGLLLLLEVALLRLVLSATRS